MSSTATRIRRARLVDTVGVLAVVAGLVLGLVPGIAAPGIAQAAHSIGDIGPGEFEIDGNADGDHDWDTLGGEQLPPDATGQTDTIFTQSQTEATYPNWSFVQQSTPQKADLLRLFVNSQTSAAGSFVWLGAQRDSSSGNVQVTAEFNKELESDLTGDYRNVGDFYIRFNFPGSVTGAVDVGIAQWQGTAWGPEKSGLAGVRTAVGNLGISSREFVELELDLAGLFGSEPGQFDCGAFGGVSFRTESSGSGANPTLKDVGGPFPLDLDTCSNVTVEKVDGEDRPLNDAEFTVFNAGDDPDTDPAVATCITGPDATDIGGEDTEADGKCSFGPLQPGDYVLYETDVPDGYAISPDIGADGYPFTVSPNTPLRLGPFEDPRLDYDISVAPVGRNPVGTDHQFTVTLDEDGAPVAGRAIALGFSTASMTQVVDANGTTDHSPATATTTCVTRADGTCLVIVNSSAIGTGTLTATYDTPYQHDNGETATGSTNGTAYDLVAASATKTWVDYEATIEADATNLVGDAHTFTATVYEVDGSGSPDRTPVDGVTVSVEWTGPDGSTLDGVAYDSDTGTPVAATCVTRVDDPGTGAEETGTCTFEVDSDVSGEGDIEITQVAGKILDSDGVTERDRTVTFGDGDGFDHPAATATKTWREYRAQIGPDALNPVGQDHPFDVWVEYSEDGGDSWSRAEIAGMTVEWSVDGGAPTAAEETESDCDDGTQADGTCTIVVQSGTHGSKTVKLLSVTGNLLPGDVPDVTDLPYTFSDDQYVNVVGDQVVETGSREATKTWLIFGANIVKDGHNLVSTPADEDLGLHHFTVTVWRKPAPGTGETAVPPGTKVTADVAWDSTVAEPAGLVVTDPALIKDNDCFAYGTSNVTTPDGLSSQCTITVNSTVPGTATVTVTGLESYDFGGEFGVEEPVVFIGDNQDSASKTWYQYRASIADDGVNLVGDEHAFTVTAEVNDGSDDNLDGSAWDPVENGTRVTVTSDSHPLTTFDQSDCDDGTTGGTCQVVVDSSTAGTVTITVATVGNKSAVDSAEVSELDVSDGALLDEDQSEFATKTWIAYRASIEESETNLTGQEHVFDVTAEQNDGVDDDGINGLWDPVPAGTEIRYTTDAAVDELSDTCDAATADGTCTITVKNNSVGEVTVTITGVEAVDVDDPTAVATTAADDGNGALSAASPGLSATKTWIDVLVDVRPDDPTNIAGDPHPFTVDLTITGPNGEVVHTGGSIGYDVDGANVVADDSTCDEALAAGQTSCTIMVDSDTAGTATISVTDVSFTYDNKPFTVDFTDESTNGEAAGQDLEATKTWLAYRTTIELDGLNRVGDAHKFTVTVEKTDVADPEPADWSPVEDAVPTLSRKSGIGDVVAGDGTCDEGTNASGQCTVWVDSAVSGTGVFHVSELVVDDPATEAVDEHTLGDGGDTDVAFDNSDTASKTWVAFRATISVDSQNTTGDAHEFVIDADYTTAIDPSEEDWSAVPEGSTIATSASGTAEILAAATVDTTDCDDGTDAGSCSVWVDSEESGSLTVTVDSLTASIPDGEGTKQFTVTFGRDTNGDPNPGLLADFDTIDRTGDGDDYASTKTWATYQLLLSPETAVNLLDGSLEVDPEENHTITARLTSDDPADDGLAPVVGQTIKFTVSDATFSGGGTEATCVTVDDDQATLDVDETGTCTVVITRDSPGQATVNATYDAKVGDSQTVTTINGDADFEEEGIQPATKTWTTFFLTVTPQNAVNLVGTPHLFTVTLWESVQTADCDSPVDGFCRVQTDDPIEIDVPGDGLTVDTTDCDDGTDADGQCEVTVTSGVVQAVTLTATYQEPYADYASATASIAAVFADYSDSGAKSWIDYDIDVVGDADNLVDTPHVFTVQLRTIVPDGEGGTTSIGIQGANPQVAITSGPGTIETDTCASVGTVVDEATPEVGTCTVTITSAVAGVTTVDASYVGYARIDGDTIADDPQDESRTYDTAASVEDSFDSGEKQWVDYLLEVTPNAVNTVGDPHTFTATLRRSDDGALDEDYLPVAGETLTWTIDPVGDRVDGEGDVGEDLTCVTDATGTCDLVINSAEAGATDVSVSYDAVVGATERTDTVERTKQWVDIELVKTAVTGDGIADGDLIADPDAFPFLSFTSGDQGPKQAVYEYTITNPSNVTLENVVLVDDRLGTITLTGECQTLDPGEICAGVRDSESFTYQDATAALGAPIRNVGVVTATGGGEDVSDTDDATIGLVAVQSSILIDLVKEVVTGAGDVEESDGLPLVTWSQEEYEAGVSKTVRYRFTVTNISNATIIDVELTDPMFGTEPIIAASDGVTLAPDEVKVIEVDHELTVAQAFPDGPIASRVDNVATVSGANQTRDSFSEDSDDASVFTGVVFAEVIEKEPPAPAVKPLPATGFGGGRLLPVSMLLIAVGVAILWLDRRRITSS